MSAPLPGPIAAAQFRVTERFYVPDGPLEPPWLATSDMTQVNQLLHGDNLGGTVNPTAYLQGVLAGNVIVADLVACTATGGSGFVDLFTCQSETTAEALILIAQIGGTNQINRQIVAYETPAGGQVNISDIAFPPVRCPIRMMIGWDPIHQPGIVYAELFQRALAPHKYTPTSGHAVAPALRPSHGDNSLVAVHLQANHNVTVDFDFVTAQGFVHTP